MSVREFISSTSATPSLGSTGNASTSLTFIPNAVALRAKCRPVPPNPTIPIVRPSNSISENLIISRFSRVHPSGPNSIAFLIFRVRAKSNPKAVSAKWPPTRPFSPVRITSLLTNSSNINMSTPDAVAWTHLRFGADSKSHFGVIPSITSAVDANSTPSLGLSTMTTVEPGPAASWIIDSSSEVTSGKVSVLVINTLSGLSGMGNCELMCNSLQRVQYLNTRRPNALQPLLCAGYRRPLLLFGLLRDSSRSDAK